MFFDRGTFGVLPLACLYLPKSAKAYLFPKFVKINYFCSGPISVDPICPQPTYACACPCLVLASSQDTTVEADCHDHNLNAFALRLQRTWSCSHTCLGFVGGSFFFNSGVLFPGCIDAFATVLAGVCALSRDALPCMYHVRVLSPFQQPTLQNNTKHQWLFSCTCSYLGCFKWTYDM